MHIHLTTDRDSTQLNAPPCMGNAEYSPTWTSPGRQGQRIDSAHAIFIHLAYNTLCFMESVSCTYVYKSLGPWRTVPQSRNHLQRIMISCTLSCPFSCPSTHWIREVAS